MKTTLKILSLMLIICVVFSFSLQTFATNLDLQKTKTVDLKSIISKDFGGLLDIILSNPDIYGISKSDFDEFAIMDPVDFICIGDHSSSTPRVFHFPVVDSNGRICLIFDIIVDNDGYSTSLGADFAPLLNSMYSKRITTMTLIQDRYSLFAISDIINKDKKSFHLMIVIMKSLSYPILIQNL